MNIILNAYISINYIQVLINKKRIKDNLKSPCEYFEFPIFKNIITKDPVSKNNVDKLFKEIHDEIIEKNYLKNSNRLIIFILMDNDVQSNCSKIIKNNFNKFSNLFKNPKIEPYCLIPKDGSCFEEFLYYHIPNIKEAFRKEEKFIKKICNYFNIDSTKGDMCISAVMRKCFSNHEDAVRTVEQLKKNLNKYNSQYKLLFDWKRIKKDKS